MVAHAHIPKEAEVGDPGWEGARRSPFFFIGLLHDLRAEVVANLVLDDFRDVGDANGVLGRWSGLRCCRLDAGSGGIRLGLPNQIGGVFLGQDAPLHQPVDQVDGDVLRWGSDITSIRSELGFGNGRRGDGERLCGWQRSRSNEIIGNHRQSAGGVQEGGEHEGEPPVEKVFFVEHRMTFLQRVSSGAAH